MYNSSKVFNANAIISACIMNMNLYRLSQLFKTLYEEWIVNKTSRPINPDIR